jgi:hypothetical protein
MKIKRDLVGGILLVLVGAAAIVAALGAMGPVGIHSSPGLLVLGAAGLVFGRILLHSGFDLRGSHDEAGVISLEAPSHTFGEPDAPSSQEQAETAWFASATEP